MEMFTCHTCRVAKCHLHDLAGLPDRHVNKVYDGDENLCKDHHCETTIDSSNKFCYKACAVLNDCGI